MTINPLHLSSPQVCHHVLDRWALELQFNIKFNHIEGKKNVVEDATSKLKTMNLYKKHQEVNPIQSIDTVEDTLENIEKYAV